MRRVPSSRSTWRHGAPARALLASCLLLAALPAEAQERICPDYLRLAERAVPEGVGDPAYLKRLASPAPSPRPLSAGFDPQRAAEALGDALESPATGSACDGGAAHGAEELCSERGSRLRYDREAGRIVYLAPERSFQAVRGEENTVSNDRALEIARKVLSALGLPEGELGEPDVRELFAAGRDPARKQRAARLRAEVHVHFGRQVGGVPVFDSTARTAVGPDARVARLRLRWPDFRIVDGLGVESARTREEVVRGIARTLSEETGRCRGWDRLQAVTAYVPTAELDGVEGGDDEERDGAAGTLYAPALVVYAAPADPEEGSGEIVSAGLQISVPLFRTAPLDRMEATGPGGG